MTNRVGADHPCGNTIDVVDSFAGLRHASKRYKTASGHQRRARWRQRLISREVWYAATFTSIHYDGIL